MALVSTEYSEAHASNCPSAEINDQSLNRDCVPFLLRDCNEKQRRLQLVVLRTEETRQLQSERKGTHLTKEKAALQLMTCHRYALFLTLRYEETQHTDTSRTLSCLRVDVSAMQP